MNLIETGSVKSDNTLKNNYVHDYTGSYKRILIGTILLILLIILGGLILFSWLYILTK
jgi:hypothetical protein